MGHLLVSAGRTELGRRAFRVIAVGLVGAMLAGCSLFGPPKLTEETIIPPETLYNAALNNMDQQRYQTAIGLLDKLERQHPYSSYDEKSKLMQVFANYRIGHYDKAVLAADRYIAEYPSSPELDYVLYLKGNSQYAQITDITRDQQMAEDAATTYSTLINTFPKSKYVKDAEDKRRVAYDQLAGKEMSVGRYYEGNGRYAAAIARFRVVVEKYPTSSHIEEALYRLVEANLKLGLVSEAQTAAAVLGHNYPASSWYKEAFNLLHAQGVEPKVNPSSGLAGALKAKA